MCAFSFFCDWKFGLHCRVCVVMYRLVYIDWSKDKKERLRRKEQNNNNNNNLTRYRTQTNIEKRTVIDPVQGTKRKNTTKVIQPTQPSSRRCRWWLVTNGPIAVYNPKKGFCGQHTQTCASPCSITVPRLFGELCKATQTMTRSVLPLAFSFRLVAKRRPVVPEEITTAAAATTSSRTTRATRRSQTTNEDVPPTATSWFSSVDVGMLELGWLCLVRQRPDQLQVPW